MLLREEDSSVLPAGASARITYCGSYSMSALNKLFLLLHLVIIGISICASESIDDGPGAEPRIFYYFKERPYMTYSKLSALKDSKMLWLNRERKISLMTGLEYYPDENSFYWTTIKGELYSAIFNETENSPETELDPKLLYAEENWTPRSMVLDRVTKKLYIADSFERSIDVFDLDGKNKARIFASEYAIPCNIVIDPNEGLLFLFAVNYTNRKIEIYRMNMDGSDRRLIVNRRIIDTDTKYDYTTLKIKESFAIDTAKKQLYYSDNSDGILTVDYNGQGGGLILTFERLSHFEFYNNRLYWSQSVPGERRMINTNEIFLYLMFNNEEYPLHSCDVSNQDLNNSSSSCEPILKHSLSIRYFNNFKIFDFAPTKNLANPCAETKNECEDHCLLKSSGVDNKLSFGCAYRLGYEINDDKQTRSDVAHKPVDDESSQYAYDTLWNLYKSNFDGDSDDGSDGSPIYNISENFLKKLLFGGPSAAFDDNLNEKYAVNKEGQLVKYVYGDKEQFIVLRNSSENIAKALAYDWVARNLYYAKLTNYDKDKYNLFVMTAKYPEHEMLLGEIDKPTSMAVHPYRGYLFIATYDQSKNESRVMRFDADGKAGRVLADTNVTDVVLAVDLGEDKLYWIDKSEENGEFVRSADLDGSNAQSVVNCNFERETTSLSVYQDHVYIKTEGGKLFIVSKIDRQTRKFKLIDLLRWTINDPVMTKGRIKKTDTQYLSAENPCVHDNGGCEMVCFAVPNYESPGLLKVCRRTRIFGLTI